MRSHVLDLRGLILGLRGLIQDIRGLIQGIGYLVLDLRGLIFGLRPTNRPPYQVLKVTCTRLKRKGRKKKEKRKKKTIFVFGKCFVVLEKTDGLKLNILRQHYLLSWVEVVIYGACSLVIIYSAEVVVYGACKMPSTDCERSTHIFVQGLFLSQIQ